MSLIVCNSDDDLLVIVIQQFCIVIELVSFVVEEGVYFVKIESDCDLCLVV